MQGTEAGTGYWRTRLLGDAAEGEERTLPGGAYALRRGIVRQLAVYSDEQAQTGEAFGFKWAKRETYEAEAVEARLRDWMTERFLGGDRARLETYFPDGARVLDAGCGAGHGAIALLGDRLNRVRYLGADISSAVDVARERFEERGLAGEFLQADFTRLPFDAPTFDAILAEGTLHHTDSTRDAVAALAPLLAPGGRFLFYVYRKKGPIREFTDDHVRAHLAGMSDEEAWEAMMPLTRLGEALGRLEVTVDVPEAIPYLGIPAGPVDLQRLFYWHVCKAFYRPEFSLDEMNHINFDWFRPANCHRHTEEEVLGWCAGLGLAVEHVDVQEAGITVVARRGE